jgi:transcriptional regulator with XRE-family HTH domain
MATVTGDRISARRKALGLTQSTLGELLNQGQSAVSHWETGRRLIEMENVLKLAVALQTTADYLMGLTDDPDQLSEDERELLRTWRRMDRKAQSDFLRELFRKYESGQS